MKVLVIFIFLLSILSGCVLVSGNTNCTIIVADDDTVSTKASGLPL